MTTYSITMANLRSYKHEHPERTAVKCIGWDYIAQIWPNRKSMAKSIRMQEKRAQRQDDWSAVMPLNDVEGY